MLTAQLTLKFYIVVNPEKSLGRNRSQAVAVPTTSGEPRPVTPNNDTSSSREGANLLFTCEECRRSFSTKSGLGVHFKRAHPVEANERINVDRVKARWPQEEILLLARREVEASRLGVVNMNLYLHELCPNRSVEAIKGRRKLLSYKAVVQAELDRQLAQPIDAPQAQEPSDAQRISHLNNIERLRHHILSLCGKILDTRGQLLHSNAGMG